VSSIRDAITLLGMGPVRRWGSLMALSGIDGQPHELLVTAAVRARTCELLARATGDRRADAYYTTGLFSVVDALMDVPLRQVLDALPLADEIRDALLEHRGGPGAALAAIKDYERGDLDEVPSVLREAIGPAYLDALEHADGVSAVVA
jgi:EAL and modified HD-GYP domain-containing signal transduction protein